MMCELLKTIAEDVVYNNLNSSVNDAGRVLIKKYP